MIPDDLRDRFEALKRGANPQKADAHLIEITPGTMMIMDKLFFETEMSSGHIVLQPPYNVLK